MVSKRQIEANKRNSLHSTGPQTSDGKERVAMNARKTGLHSTKHFLLRDDEAAFSVLRDDISQRWQPVGDTEIRIVEELTRNCWRLELLNRAEDARYAHLAARSAGERTYEFQVAGAVIGGKLLEFDEIKDQMFVEAGKAVGPSDEDFHNALRIAMSSPEEIKATALVDRMRQSAYRAIKRLEEHLRSLQHERRERKAKEEQEKAWEEEEKELAAQRAYPPLRKRRPVTAPDGG
jgi:hypothetical protein